MEENSTNLSPETLSVCWGKGTVRYSEWKINMASPQCSNISALAATVGWVAEAQMESVCLSVWNWLNDRLGVGQADWLGHGIASFGYLQINQEVVIKSQFCWNHDSYQLNFNYFITYNFEHFAVSYNKINIIKWNYPIKMHWKIQYQLKRYECRTKKGNSNEGDQISNQLWLRTLNHLLIKSHLPSCP